MNVLSVCPLRVASLEWQTSRGLPVLTVIAKATFRLQPVTSPLADEQEEPCAFDSHYKSDLAQSLHAPSDLAPFKPRPEVTLVGHAFAPRGEPVTRLLTRLIVGTVDKSIAVNGDRSFSQEGILRPAARFTRMALRYEKAGGGPDTKNPVGITNTPDSLGAVKLPNLERPDANPTRPEDVVEPVGFGPIAADWPGRRVRLGRSAGGWSAKAIKEAPLPEGIDPLYFLAAPPDQVLDELRSNERLVLENLHPDHPRLVTSLAGVEPRAFVERPGAPVADLPLTCDTLWIDTDRSLCTLTWRGQLTLDRPAQEGRVVVAEGALGRPLAWSAVKELAQGPEAQRAEDTAVWARGGARSTRTAIHDIRPAAPWPAWLASAEAAAQPPEPPPRPVTSWAPPPPAAHPELPQAVSPPLAGVTSVTSTTTGPGLPSKPKPAPAGRGADLAPPGRVPSSAELRTATERRIDVGSAAAASNAAAAVVSATPADRPRADKGAAPAREPPREHVDLLWFDPAALPRIAAAKLLAPDRPERSGVRWIKEGSAPREPQEARDRAELLAILTRAKPCDEPAALDEVASLAYRDDGTFAAPLLLVTGELAFHFDELEALRATLTVTAPLRGADKKLREVSEAALDALKAEGRLPSDIVSGLTRRIEEAFVQGQRSVAPGYLETSVERILLEDRRYARKTLFGEPRLRAALTFPAGGAPLPTYLPEALATRLPLFRRFRARAIVELRPQEDQYETHPEALVVFALGRIIRRGG